MRRSRSPERWSGRILRQIRRGTHSVSRSRSRPGGERISHSWRQSKSRSTSPREGQMRWNTRGTHFVDTLEAPEERSRFPIRAPETLFPSHVTQTPKMMVVLSDRPLSRTRSSSRISFPSSQPASAPAGIPLDHHVRIRSISWDPSSRGPRSHSPPHTRHNALSAKPSIAVSPILRDLMPPPSTGRSRRQRRSESPHYLLHPLRRCASPSSIRRSM